ncbi:2-dehydro-3-deoxyphosphogluconate aldolase [Pradoshia eiseniae]|uniref:2-dehydro-3-deoxyphosphogluconate aldolase n=1 Tax=Pradoshia eiseniae TaxID=2064768 RepID=A0A2S7N144_9BACI|nr:bifunctional 4-hydroxy-2-oxoglutarate aldolase/2-dehydro-3-deoxy-phosphogluconate aldolase [Pradoshia eiseniae]PQD95733.1 2-dehydro-3-deoxyphosphogluconate aldolase [Pradoshia eiseniae]
MKEDLLEVLKREKIIAIIRGIPTGTVISVAQALLDGGILFLEVTMNTENADLMIRELKQTYGNQLIIGAGTVLNVELAKKAIDAGAEYIISPNLDEKVIQYCVNNEIDVWSGALTPTEITKAYNLGSKAVKVFPIGSLGVNYIKDIKAPLNHIPLIATGGINEENIQQTLKNGAIGVGLGGNLVSNALVEQGNYGEITKRAKAFIQLANEV